MRILQIRFKNLNSLAGEWAIDLTHPAYASDGIFAITGPTGAGKTTILDAICLALYGRTPRLNKITRSSNEIMSRQTGECFAEVSFETQSGRYRCHWSQHRARKKPDGELQNPKHEIANADTGEIFEAKIRGVAEQIETATGMDFERFARSMLLAQGDFAAFLQAAPDERAPILEQITGTEIYSRISVRVHERHAEERKKMDALQAELAGIQILSVEEEQQLNIRLKQKTEQDIELNHQITGRRHAILWLEGIARLEEEFRQLDQRKTVLHAGLDAFAPEQARLDAAVRALELAGDFASLIALRTAQQTDQRLVNECMESLPLIQEGAETAEATMQSASALLETTKTEQTKMLPIIRKVRELDLKTAEKANSIHAVQEAITETASSLGMLYDKQETDSAELAGQYKALADILQKLEESKADEALVENLAGIRSRFETLKHLHSQLLEKLDESKEAGNQLQNVLEDWRKQSKELDEKKSALEGKQTVLAEKKEVLAKILENRELTVWRKNQLRLAAQRELLSQALVAYASLLKSKQAFCDLDNRIAMLISEESGLKSRWAIQSEKHTGLQNKIELLETQLTLLNKIKDMKEMRRQLQDGEPCPLCGAKEHPFAEGNVPAPDETRLCLVEARGGLKSVMDEMSNLKIGVAQVEKDLEQAAADKEEHAGNIEQTTQRITEIFSSLTLDLKVSDFEPELGEKLDGLLKNTSQSLENVIKTVETAEAAEKECYALRDALEKSKESVGQAELTAKDFAHKKDSAEQRMERLSKELQNCRDQQNNSFFLLQRNVGNYGIATLSMDALDEILELLTTRRDQWTMRQTAKSEIEKKVATLDIQTGNRAEQIQESEKEIEKQRAQLAGLIQARDSCASERKNVFGDGDPEKEEERLATAILAAEMALEEARLKQTTAKQAFTQQQSKIEGLEKAMADRSRPLQSSEKHFSVRLENSGFSDEESYTSACLPENERKRLVEQSRKLADEKTEIALRELEKNELLQTERAKQMTEEPLDALKSAWAILIATEKEIQQEIGGIYQQLKNNEQQKEKQQKRGDDVHKQKSECARWDRLHELIGSADGKKYRNFAQGLTFEMMIGHANRQLQKMTDRYLLIRDGSQPLELNVVDSYQAGEIRSTKNLSGGESFIVSLSLALGLSHMAGRNVRIDSLFLDEGFGSLDEEALDTALETLGSLQQAGKLIGVISHVSALKERISTQVQVIPQPGGRSQLLGPGCRMSKSN
jgi:DNA repair protein SbcC/Rad50